VVVSGKRKGGKGAKKWNIQCAVGSDSKWMSSENIELEMWHFPQKYTCWVLQKAISWLHKIAFLVEMYRVHWYWCQRRIITYVRMNYET
jgi:hypothetical protein